MSEAPPLAPDGAVEPAAIPSNLRLIIILEAVARAGRPVTPTEINSEMGLPKPTIHRLFATLEAERFLQREIDGRSYSPGPRMNRLAVETVSAVRVRGARVVVLEKLARETGETCNLAIPERDAMTYLDRVETHWPLRIQLPVGTRVPLHATAAGKMYLASLDAARRERYTNNMKLERLTPGTITSRTRLGEELDRIAEQGHAEDAGEFVEGMIAMAVPIRDRQGSLFATLSFHAPTLRMDLEEGRRHLPALNRAAAELSRIVTA